MAQKAAFRKKKVLADTVAVSDDLRIKIVHVAPKATATNIAKSLHISPASLKRARVLVEKISKS